MSDPVALRPDIVHAAVPEPLHDRSAEGVVVGLERASVPLALLEQGALVRLQSCRVPDHVGDHHCDEPAVERLAHGGSAALDSSRSLVRVRSTLTSVPLRS